MAVGGEKQTISQLSQSLCAMCFPLTDPLQALRNHILVRLVARSEALLRQVDRQPRWVSLRDLSTIFWSSVEVGHPAFMYLRRRHWLAGSLG